MIDWFVRHTLPTVRRLGYRGSYFGWFPCIIREEPFEVFGKTPGSTLTVGDRTITETLVVHNAPAMTIRDTSRGNDRG